MNRRARWSWIFIDIGNSGFSTTIIAAVFPVYLPSLLPKDGLHFLWGPIDWTCSAISLWGYTVSFSIFLTFLISPILGAWADEGGYRKRLLAVFTLLGVIGTLGLGFTHDWRAALLSFVVANMGFCGNNILYNSLLPSVAPQEDWHKLSLQGFAWGYVMGGVLLAINLLMIMKFEWFGLTSKDAGVHLSFISVALWWLVMTLPSLFWIPETRGAGAGALHIKKRVVGLFHTFLEILKSRTLALFMLSYAFFNDGIQTVISMATIYGKEALHFSEGTLIGTLLMIQFLGLPFTLMMDPLQSRFGAKRVLMSSLVVWIGIIGFSYTMTLPIHFWILGGLVSIVLGVPSALARSIFAKLIPEGRQTEYFSFFAISGKMTSIMGPLVFGLVNDFSNDSRLSILSISIFFILGLILLQFVSIDPTKTARID